MYSKPALMEVKTVSDVVNVFLSVFMVIPIFFVFVPILSSFAEKAVQVTKHRWVRDIAEKWRGEGAEKETAKNKECIIPQKVNEVPAGAFSGCVFSSVILPDSVKKIGECAFCSCRNLNSIRFGKNIKKIEDFAFLECYRLNEIRLPGSVKHVGQGNLESVHTVWLENGTDVGAIRYALFSMRNARPDNRFSAAQASFDKPGRPSVTTVYVNGNAVYYPKYFADADVMQWAIENIYSPGEIWKRLFRDYQKKFSVGEMLYEKMHAGDRDAGWDYAELLQQRWMVAELCEKAPGLPFLQAFLSEDAEIAEDIAGQLVEDGKEEAVVRLVQAGIISAGTARAVLPRAQEKEMAGACAYLLGAACPEKAQDPEEAFAL